jgi:hypothetical protein
MKKQFLLGVSFCVLSAVQAQTLHTIDFNTYVSGSNNDLMNNFSGSFALTQQTTNGITGGSVLPASTLTSSKAQYNGKCYLRPADPNPTSASISFKYSASGASSGDGGPEVGFFITSDSTGSLANGFVTANISLYPFGGCMFNVDGAINHYSSASFTLIDGHWYQLQLKIQAINMDSINTSTYVYELGAAGTTSPVLVASFLNNIEKTSGITWPHSFFVPTLNGGLSGGVVYMDNFNVSSYATPTGIKTVGQADNFISNPVTSKLSVTTGFKGDIGYVIYNTAGIKLSMGIINGSADIDVSALPAALYFIRLSSEGNTTVQKFVKQ